MSLITHSETVSKHDLQPGDHLLVRRHSILYSHHGIYVGDEQVIHFYEDMKNFNSRIVLTSLDKFLKNGNLRRKIYKHRSNPQIIVDRAYSLLNNRGYDLIENNCEHMATWCVTGKKESNQVNRFFAIAGSSIVAFAGAGIALLSRKSRKSLF